MLIKCINDSVVNCTVGKHSEADEVLHSDASEVSDMSISLFSVRSTQSEQPNRTLRSLYNRLRLGCFTCAGCIAVESCGFLVFSLIFVYQSWCRDFLQTGAGKNLSSFGEAIRIDSVHWVGPYILIQSHIFVPSAVLDPRIGRFMDNLPPSNSVFNDHQSAQSTSWCYPANVVK